MKFVVCLSSPSPHIFFRSQLIQKEYFNLQVQSDRRLMEIDTELNDKRTKLQVYEKVEQELDEVVMQAAQGNVPSFRSS